MIRSFLTYNYEANLAYIQAIEGMDDGDERRRCQELLCHVVNAQFIWYDRFKSGKTELHPWKFWELNDLKRLNEEAYVKTVKVMEAYHGSLIKAGDTDEIHAPDIMLHIVKHGSYHRGQIASLLVQLKIPVPVTDYIHWLKK